MWPLSFLMAPSLGLEECPDLEGIETSHADYCTNETD